MPKHKKHHAIRSEDTAGFTEEINNGIVEPIYDDITSTTINQTYAQKTYDLFFGKGTLKVPFGEAKIKGENKVHMSEIASWSGKAYLTYGADAAHQDAELTFQQKFLMKSATEKLAAKPDKSICQEGKPAHYWVEKKPYEMQPASDLEMAHISIRGERSDGKVFTEYAYYDPKIWPDHKLTEVRLELLKACNNALDEHLNDI